MGRSDAGCAGAGEVSPNVSPVVLSLPSVPAPSEDAGPVPAVTTSDDAGLRRAVHLLPHRVRPLPRPEPRLLHGRRRGQTRPKVISIQFLDFDTEGTLLVINQDDTYEDVAFTDGQTVEFTSISAKLDPDEPLSEQLNKVPGGAQLTLRGRAVNDDTGLETIVSVRLTWSYTNACDEVPLAEGMELAWVTFVSVSIVWCRGCPGWQVSWTVGCHEAVREWGRRRVCLLSTSWRRAAQCLGLGRRPPQRLMAVVTMWATCLIIMALGGPVYWLGRRMGGRAALPLPLVPASTSGGRGYHVRSPWPATYPVSPSSLPSLRRTTSPPPRKPSVRRLPRARPRSPPPRQPRS